MTLPVVPLPFVSLVLESRAYNCSTFWKEGYSSRIARALITPVAKIAEWALKLFYGPSIGFQIKREKAILVASKCNDQKVMDSLVEWTQHITKEFNTFARRSSRGQTIYDVAHQVIKALDHSVNFRQLPRRRQERFKQIARIAFIYAIADLIVSELEGYQRVTSLNLCKLKALTNHQQIVDKAFHRAFLKRSLENREQICLLLKPHRENENGEYLLERVSVSVEEAIKDDNIDALWFLYDRARKLGGDVGALREAIRKNIIASLSETRELFDSNPSKFGELYDEVVSFDKEILDLDVEELTRVHSDLKAYMQRQILLSASLD